MKMKNGGEAQSPAQPRLALLVGDSDGRHQVYRLQSDAATPLVAAIRDECVEQLSRHESAMIYVIEGERE